MRIKNGQERLTSVTFLCIKHMNLLEKCHTTKLSMKLLVLKQEHPVPIKFEFFYEVCQRRWRVFPTPLITVNSVRFYKNVLCIDKRRVQQKKCVS